MILLKVFFVKFVQFGKSIPIFLSDIIIEETECTGKSKHSNKATKYYIRQ